LLFNQFLLCFRRMNSNSFAALARRLMRCPAAAWHEQLVAAEVKKICTENDLSFQQDDSGNFILPLKQGARGVRPLILSAHMDHPGFHVLSMLDERNALVRFAGGVPDEYFREGLPVRLFPGGIQGRLGKRRAKKEFELRLESVPTEPPKFGVWDLGDYELKRTRIHGRACDDLIGVASVLATLIELKKRRASVNVIGVLTRAEEVGFHGALLLARSKRLPRTGLVVSLEASRECPPVEMGMGVVIRVGDRSSIFDSEATRFLTEVAGEMKSKQFRFQRALMPGGTCEGTAFQEHGFQTAAVCVPLGNYHNCTPDGKIAEEFVSVLDACRMVDLLVEAACRMKDYSRLTRKLTDSLAKLEKEARKAAAAAS
jgi:putative aminopeptidase FrvX